MAQVFAKEEPNGVLDQRPWVVFVDGKKLLKIIRHTEVERKFGSKEPAIKAGKKYAKDSKL